MSETATLPPPTETTPIVTVDLPPKTLPYLSIIFVVALAIIFVLELLFGVDPPTNLLEPSVRTFLALGGLQYLLTIDQGQWWRVFTGPLLHANLLHIALNSITLVLAGAVLERVVGRWWFAAIFVVGGLGGAGGSLLINPRNLVSVGASGAIMGTFAAILVLSFRYEAPQIRTALRGRALQVLIPSLLPFLSVGAGKVDYGAHVGGALAGAAFACLLSSIMDLDRKTDVLPRFRSVAAVIATLGLTGALVGVAKVSQNPNPPPLVPAADPTRLIPDEYLPKKESDIHEASAWWFVAKYPGDPRSHYYKALFLLRKPDLAEAERELRAGLDQKMLLDKLGPAFKLTLEGSLALVLLSENRTDAAREVAAAACLDRSSTIFPKLQARGLCTGTD